MQNDEHVIPDTAKRKPWNKGKLIGAKPPLRPKHVWSIRTKLQVGAHVTSQCSISPSTASCGGATSLPSRSRTSHRVDWPSIGQRYDKRKPAGP